MNKPNETDELVIPITLDKGVRQSKVVVSKKGRESLASRIMDACKSAFGSGKLVPDAKRKSYRWMRDNAD